MILYRTRDSKYYNVAFLDFVVKIFTGFTTKLLGGILGFLPLVYIIWRVYESMIKKEEIDKTRSSLRYGVAIEFGILWVLYGIVWYCMVFSISWVLKLPDLYCTRYLIYYQKGYLLHLYMLIE